MVPYMTNGQNMGNAQAMMNRQNTMNGRNMANDQVNSQASDPGNERNWEGLDQLVGDPEEARVMFCALDSFA